MLKFEQKSQPMISNNAFIMRMGNYFMLSGLAITFSLTLGMLGYHFLAGFSWLDSLLNASMILTGMGPVNPVTTVAGKLFASFYALYSGVAFLTTIALFLSPLVHRLMHSLHLEGK
jgi:hypothetical protein